MPYKISNLAILRYSKHYCKSFIPIACLYFYHTLFEPDLGWIPIVYRLISNGKDFRRFSCAVLFSSLAFTIEIFQTLQEFLVSLSNGLFNLSFRPVGTVIIKPFTALYPIVSLGDKRF